MAKLKTVPPAAVEPAAAPVKKSRKTLIIALSLAVLAAGGGGAWYMLKPSAAHNLAVAEKKPPVFVNMEPFTVNLQPENGDHYLQVGVVYQVTDDKATDAMKTYLPMIRSRLLLLLSGKRPSELVTAEGKKKLVDELIAAARESLPEGATPERGIQSAFLAAFVIQ